MKDTRDEKDFVLKKEIEKLNIPEAPNFDNMMQRSYLAAERIKEARKEKRESGFLSKRVPLRFAIVLSIILTAGVLAITVPTNSEAETLWERMVEVFDSVIRIDRKPTGEHLPPISVGQEHLQFSSIDEAKGIGYEFYYPTYLPEGYKIDSIAVIDNDSKYNVRIAIKNADEEYIFLTYDKRNDDWGYSDLPLDGVKSKKDISWNGSMGILVSSYDGKVFFDWFNAESFEQISIFGQSTEDEFKKIIEGLAK